MAKADHDSSMASGLSRRRRRALRAGTESYGERRREIMQAAAEVFNEKGFRGASLGAVAAKLGTDRASLYYYIGSKEELFDEVVRQATEANVARARAIESSNSSAADKLRMLITELMVSYARNYPLLYLYIRENLNDVANERSAWANRMKSLNKRYERSVIAIVQQGIDDGSFRPLASASVIAFGILGRSTNRWAAPERSYDSAEAIGAAYAELVLAGLQVSPGATAQGPGAAAEAGRAGSDAKSGAKS